MAMVNLFFAIKPPTAKASAIAQFAAVIRSAHGLCGQSMGAERLHVTLAPCHAGRQGLDDAIERAMAVGAALRHHAFPVTFEWTESFYSRPGRCPLVLRGEQGLGDLCAFRADLRDRMRRAGLGVDPGFTPHVTLIWADRLVGQHPVAPICWQAAELLLVQSHVGHSRHTHVAQWRLE